MQIERGLAQMIIDAQVHLLEVENFDKERRDKLGMSYLKDTSIDEFIQ